MFGAVFLIGVAAACCGGLPLALVFGAAGGAGLLTGFGVLGLAIFSAVSVSLIALRRRRDQPGACRHVGEPVGREGDDHKETLAEDCCTQASEPGRSGGLALEARR
jgi:hypothetical protein